jgi:hypothetical protein
MGLWVRFSPKRVGSYKAKITVFPGQRPIIIIIVSNKRKGEKKRQLIKLSQQSLTKFENQ